jgi:hypothetical protein
VQLFPNLAVPPAAAVVLNLAEFNSDEVIEASTYMTLFLIATCIVSAWAILAQIGAERDRGVAQLKREIAKATDEQSKK